MRRITGPTCFALAPRCVAERPELRPGEGAGHLVARHLVACHLVGEEA